MHRTQVKAIGKKGDAALVLYGKGLGGIAVLEQKSDGQSQSNSGRGGGLPSVSIGGTTGQELPTALGTIVRFERGGVSYTVLGSQPSSVVLAAARSL
jgi:general stress protein YciG